MSNKFQALKSLYPNVQYMRDDIAYDESENVIVFNDAAVSLEEAKLDAKEKRFFLLLETDWVATSDRTMTSEQTAYRQALRDITDQADFPDNITWPTKPE